MTTRPAKKRQRMNSDMATTVESQKPQEMDILEAGQNDSAMNNNNGCQQTPTDSSVNNASDITLASINATLELINSKVDRIELAQNKLDNEIRGEIQEQMSDIQRDIGENSGLIASANYQYRELKQEVDMLKAVVLKQSLQITHLQSENDDLKNRSMRNNVLFHNLYELPDKSQEHPEQTVIRFLQNTKMLDVGNLVFERVHRIGQFDPKAKYPRPIVAKLLSSKDTDRVLAHGKTLPRGDENNHLPRITPQFTPYLREARKNLSQIANDVKEKNPETKVTTRLAKDKLYVNNELHKEPVTVPTTPEILSLSTEDREEAQSINLISGSTFNLGGHAFVATAAKVQSINDVRLAYRKLLLHPPCASAAHNICAYTLFNHSTTKSTTGHVDDGEHGVGRFLSTILTKRNAKDVVVFVTRRFLTSTHLGAARFETIEQAVVSALNALNN